MPSRSSASAFDRLAPDQRAAVELVLRQGRSYGELAEMLGMPEDTIRARARNGLTGLAPDLLPPPRVGEIADWLLGQQSEAHAARTRELVLSDPAAQRWAGTVAETLRGAPGGESVPALPTAPDEAAPRVNGHAPSVDEVVAEDEPAPNAPGGSSRLGGALIIGAAVVLVAAGPGVVFPRRGHHPGPPGGPPGAAAPPPAPGPPPAPHNPPQGPPGPQGGGGG